MAGPLKDYVITAHAMFEMRRRGIAETLLRQVLAAPDQRHTVRPGRDVLQSKIELDGRLYLLRIFVDVDRSPADVVTAYRTSNIAKYWRPD